MSDQLFEVAFSGQIRDGTNLEEVKGRVAKMFKADDSKVAQLFSGKRVVIKKNVDQATAAKYKTALNRAGAECEINPQHAEPPVQTADAADAVASEELVTTPVSMQIETSYDGEVEPPPQTDPLGITGDQIEDLAVSIAPVGSELQDGHQEPEEPAIDITGIEIAPVGSDLGTTTKKSDPPPPDITGITLAE